MIGGMLVGQDGAKSSFKPTSIPNCINWLRADLGIIFYTGVLVEQWLDQSGIQTFGSGNQNIPSAGQTPSLIASDPNFNGQSSVTFATTGFTATSSLMAAGAANNNWNTTASTWTSYTVCLSLIHI